MQRQRNAVHVIKRGLELPRAVIECTLPLMSQKEVKVLQSALTAYRLQDHCKESDKLRVDDLLYALRLCSTDPRDLGVDE